VLNRCIAVDPQAFAREHWGIRPLLSDHAALPRDFRDLLSPDAVDELLAERGVRAPFIRLAKDGDLLARDCYLGPAGFGAEVTDQVDSGKVLAHFAAGATVVLQGLHRLWPPVIDFVREAVDDLGHPVQANAYITPPGNRGFDLHHDVHDVFVLQVAGRKRWVVHEPVRRHPLPTESWTQFRADIERRGRDEPVIDTVLEEGDALYLPRGWVHAAQGMDTTSIHLTIGVSPTTPYDVARAVVDQLADVEAFRAPLPLGADAAERDETVAMITKVMAAMIDELRDDATSLSHAAAEQLQRRHAARTRPHAVRPLASFRAAEAADRTTVQWRHGLIATLEARPDGRTALRTSQTTLTFPAFCAPALAALHHGTPATAGALPGLDADDGAVLIRRLLREGILVPVDGRA
jgi:bifunctional lysine-specific demethylase and histidyl-hydroxylase NO66